MFIIEHLTGVIRRVPEPGQDWFLEVNRIPRHALQKKLQNSSPYLRTLIWTSVHNKAISMGSDFAK